MTPGNKKPGSGRRGVLSPAARNRTGIWRPDEGGSDHRGWRGGAFGEGKAKRRIRRAKSCDVRGMMAGPATATTRSAGSARSRRPEAGLNHRLPEPTIQDRHQAQALGLKEAGPADVPAILGREPAEARAQSPQAGL